MVARLRNREFGAVQMQNSVGRELDVPRRDRRFAPPILRAIQQYYRPGFTNQDGTIYLPR
jgi:hypothetical protein